MSNQIYSISKAPRDVPILTEEGLVIDFDGEWCFCDMDGHVFYNADGRVSKAEPEYWIEIPELWMLVFDGRNKK